MRSIHDRKILSESERKEIFLNIGKICALNLDLLRELEMRFLDWYICYMHISNSVSFMTEILHFVIVLNFVGILTPELLIPL